MQGPPHIVTGTNVSRLWLLLYGVKYGQMTGGRLVIMEQGVPCPLTVCQYVYSSKLVFACGFYLFQLGKRRQKGKKKKLLEETHNVLRHRAHVKCTPPVPSRLDPK
ncbi:hypothetical protein LI328DRAFT_132538 [Trichoderma asperelloides]|nr:hypothetical protein LI328DRAFT_132538 [Trichoderma asperelloides]